VSGWTNILFWAAIIGAAFAYLWWQGQIRQLANYVQETAKNEKCSWPSWEELKGSTVLIHDLYCPAWAHSPKWWTASCISFSSLFEHHAQANGLSIHTLSGQEQKVKESIEKRVKTDEMQDYVKEVLVPMEKVVEVRNQKKTRVQPQAVAGLRVCGHGAAG